MNNIEGKAEAKILAKFERVRSGEVLHEESREIRMTVESYPDRNDLKTLKFHGGPTGYEEYRLEDLFTPLNNIMNKPADGAFFINAGSDVYKRCSVNRGEVQIFLQPFYEEFNLRT